MSRNARRPRKPHLVSVAFISMCAIAAYMLLYQNTQWLHISSTRGNAPGDQPALINNTRPSQSPATATEEPTSTKQPQQASQPSPPDVVWSGRTRHPRVAGKQRSFPFVRTLFSAPEKCNAQTLITHTELNPRAVDIPPRYRVALSTILRASLTEINAMESVISTVESSEFAGLVTRGQTFDTLSNQDVKRQRVGGQDVMAVSTRLPRYEHPELGEIRYRVSEIHMPSGRIRSARLRDMPNTQALWRYRANQVLSLGLGIIDFFRAVQSITDSEHSALLTELRDMRDFHLQR